MGRGDKKTKKGKISIGSYGVTRNRKKIKAKLKRSHIVKPAVVVAAVAVAEKPKAKRTVRKKESAAE